MEARRNSFGWPTVNISPDEAARQQKAIEAISEAWKERFKAIGNEIGLRKWCVEMCASKGVEFLSPSELLRFVTAPIADILTNGLPEQSGSQDPDGSKP